MDYSVTDTRYNVNSRKMHYHIPLFFCVLAISLSISAIFSRIPIFPAEILSQSACIEHGVAAIHFVVCCKRNRWVNMRKYSMFHTLSIFIRFSRTKEALCEVSFFLLQRQKHFLRQSFRVAKVRFETATIARTFVMAAPLPFPINLFWLISAMQRSAVWSIRLHCR